MMKKDLLMKLEGIPNFFTMLPLSLQHLIAMIMGCVTVPILVAGASGASNNDLAILIQGGLVISGISILFQVLPFGKYFGSKLPLITGSSFVFIPAYIAIGSEQGLAVLFGAQIVGSLAAIVFGCFVGKLRKFFPPIVTGTIIITIGLSLYTTAVNYMAGGLGSPTFGSTTSWLVSIFTMIVVLVLSHFSKGIFKLASVFFGIIAGYVLAFILGIVDLSPLYSAALVQPPQPFFFGLSFEFSSCITLAFVYIVNAIEMIGDVTSTTTGALNREPKSRELSGGIIASATASALGSFIGGIGVGSYSQNVGIVISNKVVNRAVFGLCGIIIILAGMMPKFAQLFTTIPQAVLGGAIVAVFGIITMTGMRLVSLEGFSYRTMYIVGLAIALGMGVSLAPDTLSGLPSVVKTLFGTSAVVLSGCVAIVLNLVIPKEKKNENSNTSDETVLEISQKETKDSI